MTSVVTAGNRASVLLERRAAAPARLRPLVVLGLVAAVYTITQLLAGRLDSPLSWDETVYASQFSREVPPAVYSPHRSVGIALLVAPVTAVTDSVLALRSYLGVLSGLGLFLAFWPWLKVRDGYLVPVAAAAFASLWLPLYYGERAMPNLYIAFCVVGAVALFIRATRAGTAWPPAVGLAAVLAAVTLLRPVDATMAAAPMLAAALVVRQWRHFRAPLAIAVGLAVGWGQWLVESYLRFGGPFVRLRDTAQLNETGLHLSVVRQLRSLSGTLACFPGRDCGPIPLGDAAWWAAGGILVIMALVAGRPQRLRAVWLLTGAVAGSVALPYLVLTGYAAPRYLLPSYALLALPAAAGMGTLLTYRWRPHAAAPYRWRRYAAAAMCLAVALHLGGQLHSLRRISAEADAERLEDHAIARKLAALGVRPPCLVDGGNAPVIAYQLKCQNWDLADHMHSRAETFRRLARAADTGHTVALVSRRRIADFREPGWFHQRLWPDRRWQVAIRAAADRAHPSPPRSRTS